MGVMVLRAKIVAIDPSNTCHSSGEVIVGMLPGATGLQIGACDTDRRRSSVLVLVSLL